MQKQAICELKCRSGLLCSVSVAAVLALWAPESGAQQTPTPETGGNAIEVVVTGTRVKREGYDAPTPTSVLGEEEIAAKSPANIADFVNELPALSGSATPATQIGFVSAGTTGINALNLRNLGQNRTLVLLDGQRVGTSTTTGWVDVNQFPQALIKRVDVVTGGASADWGSDAVAGVVNFVLDKNFTGVKGEAQGGLTTYGDDGQYKLSVAAGSGFANGRGHVLLSLETASDNGVEGVPRNWYNGSKIIQVQNPAPGQPALVATSGAGLSTATPGGIITNGPLKGTYFGQGGTPLQFNYGSLVGTNNFMQGGQSKYSDALATSGDLMPRLGRQNVFLRSSFDVTDNIQVYAQGSYGVANSHEASLDQFNFGNITIQGDNALIPASTAAQMKALNLTSLTLGTTNQDLGPIIAVTHRSAARGVVGAEGDFNFLGTDWNWDVYGQRSVNHIYAAAEDISITSNYKAAMDAVVNPATGAIVCRSTLTNPTNGCVPYNVFGTGVNSKAAISYIEGTAWSRTQIAENTASGTLRGDPFSTWAGPVSIAAGIEYRTETVGGSNDPLSATRSYFAGNYQATHGSYDVTEGFIEAVVPLAKDMFLAKSIDLNAAFRGTSYSTAGYVNTWKLGPTWSPIEDITFRATRSRDIRSPDLAELFQSAQTSTTSVTDPTRGGAAATAFQVTNGNLNLRPEVADTTGVGVVVKPRFLEGFAASADMYNISIKNAITTLVAQQVVNTCYTGYTALCADISRDSTGAISAVTVQPINLATQIARGLDLETSYRKNLETIAPFLDGHLTLRGMATHFLKNWTSTGLSPATDNTGDNSQNVTSGTSLPHWRYLASVGWENGPLSTLLTARGFSDGVINTSYIQCTSNCPVSTTAHMTINNNHLPGALYFDANVTYQLPYQTDSSVFLSVDNIANAAPVQVPYGPNLGTAPLSVNPGLYDVLGRTFHFGVRFKM